MGTDSTEKYWYNMATGAVEYGRLSPSFDRVGPFDTSAEAARALDVLRENSARWREEEGEERG